MLGRRKKQDELFCYGVRLEERIPFKHPLRSVKKILDLSFVRGEVSGFYGYNGNESVDPEVIVKLMLLLSGRHQKRAGVDADASLPDGLPLVPGLRP